MAWIRLEGVGGSGREGGSGGGGRRGLGVFFADVEEMEFGSVIVGVIAMRRDG